ncbi:hypothetical protein HYH02_010173 [Chlamydomonas schloesseri]|uniref:Guanylate cyclase domain-containing protein n=1 Tax=Chlamydomonas schloesseri TaxID=2026947 RepID=A0A835W4T0_9CHLO|nr:hypothetical protein HYH02_010173 [Chlamydomonas schloesseri]|eukprot:KAG2440592.1 hypothetical protein HYH02_010173 [Chlamydomonas schloesseri]
MNTSQPSPIERSDPGGTSPAGDLTPGAQSTQPSPLPTPFGAISNVPAVGDKELRKQDSFAARVRAARRVPTLLRENSSSLPAGAPAALFRWETRGHFWSELEKAPMDSRGSGRGVHGSVLQRFGRAASMWCQAANVSCKNVWAVVRRKPSILVWPLLLLAVLLTVGIVGVTLGANDYESSSQDEALVAGAKAVNALQLTVERALQPLRATEAVVQLQPAMAVLGPALRRISARPLDQAPPVMTSLFLSPFGLVRANVTPRYESPATAAAVTPPPGTLLMPGEPLRLGQVQDILLRLPDWLPAGTRVPSPVNTTTSPTASTPKAADATSALLVAHKPVLIVNARPSDSWNNTSPCAPLSQSELLLDADATAALASNPSVAGGHCLFVTNSTNATTAGGGAALPDGVFVAVNGTRLWGFVSALVRVEDLVKQPASGLQQLRALGYIWRLVIRTAQLPGAGAALVTTVSCDTPPSEGGAQALSVAVYDAVWQLQLEKEGGHRPTWEAPLIAVVVLVSLALSALLFAALVIQQRHLILLEAMLPKKVIKLLGTGRPFYQHFECVTVLYADIIRYSNAPTGMPPWEVVSLLNDIHNMYDSLLEKHGLIKIRRSGEAFMGVGGCPTAEDPVKSALRAALCAREMVLATASFRSSAGQRVQIRLGLHSGPVVAAVVGTHMPRFSLFGDTIDISHFMEATSSIMRVHVSDTTAELLTIADDPLISLQPRGVIDVKGRGAITTSWLRLDLLSSVTGLGTDRPSRQLTMAGDARSSRPSAQPPSLQAPWGADGERESYQGGPPSAGGAGGGGGGRASAGGALAAAGASRGGQQPGGGRGGGGEDGSVRGGRAGGGPREARADIACAADLAVAAAMGVRGAPLVRKLSQTGLTQTRRALPDRRQREGVATAAAAAVERSLLGSFTLRLEEMTVGIFRTLMATPLPPPILVSGPGEDIVEVEEAGGGGRYDLRDVAGWMSAPKPLAQRQQQELPKQELPVEAEDEAVVAMADDEAAVPSTAAADASPVTVEVSATTAATASGGDGTPEQLATGSDASALTGEPAAATLAGGSGSSSRHVAAAPTTGTVAADEPGGTDTSRWGSTVGSGSSSRSRADVASAVGVQVAVAVNGDGGGEEGDVKRAQQPATAVACAEIEEAGTGC